MDTAKLGAAAAIAGAIGIGLWCLARDDAPIGEGLGGQSLDFTRKHTVEKLIEISEELELEFICVYTRVYNMMLKFKENGTWEGRMLKSLQGQVNEDLKMKTGQVLKQDCYQDLNVNPEDLELWIKHFAKHPRIVKQADLLSKLDHDIFTKERIDEINFIDQLPEAMDSKMYVSMYKKVWATIRHIMYNKIMERKTELGLGENDSLPPNEFIKIQNDTHEDFESVRNDIWELMMDEKVIPEEKRARKMMQKAYATFATVAQFENDYKPAEAVRSRWADQVSVVAQKHTKYIEEFQKNKFYSGIETDPRNSKEPDEKVGLKSAPGYQRGQTGVRLERKNTLADEGRNVQQMEPKAQKLISNYSKNFKERFRLKKQEEAAKKKENAIQVDDKIVKEVEAPVAEDVKLTEQKTVPDVKVEPEAEPKVVAEEETKATEVVEKVEEDQKAAEQVANPEEQSAPEQVATIEEQKAPEPEKKEKKSLIDMALEKSTVSVKEPAAEQVAAPEEQVAAPEEQVAAFEEQVAAPEEQKAAETAPVVTDKLPALKEESVETAKE